MLLTMMVQSAEPLYSLLLWRGKNTTESSSEIPAADRNLMITTCVFACMNYVTLGYTEPARCHHDPPGFSDICRWCRCPTP